MPCSGSCVRSETATGSHPHPIDSQRMQRIPDDGKDYTLPPGLGRFPLRHVDDFAASVPALWKRHG